jgi:hypothetical protein
MISAVRLIGRRIQSELDGPDNPAVELCRQQYNIACRNRSRGLLEKRDMKLTLAPPSTQSTSTSANCLSAVSPIGPPRQMISEAVSVATPFIVVSVVRVCL